MVWAPDREQALARMDRALGEFRITGEGIRTPVGFLRPALAHPDLRSTTHTTGLIGTMSAEKVTRHQPIRAAEE
nr:hypothetical protein [Streptomyces sp. NA02950]